jgi:hypothetical protein
VAPRRFRFQNRAASAAKQIQSETADRSERRAGGEGYRMPPTRRAKPISVVEARRLYEQTNLPVDHIAAMHGVTRTALYKRIHMWNWRMRRPLVPLTDPPRHPDEFFGETALAQGAEPDLAAAAAKLMRAVDTELDAVTEILRKLTPDANEERERAHRMLASLARTTQEITRLHVPGPAPVGQDVNDRGPADTNEFVRELVRRMDEFARRAKAAVPGDPSGDVR